MSVEETTLYRLYGNDGVLLYVGISRNWARRMIEHRKEKHWFSEVIDIRVETFMSRDEAITAEREAILEEKPLHNVQHNSRTYPHNYHLKWRIDEAILTWADQMRREIESRPSNSALTLYDAADILGMPFRMVQRLVRTRDIPVFQGRNQQVIVVADLAKWVDDIANEVAS